MSGFRRIVVPAVENISQAEMDVLLAAMRKVLESETSGVPTKGSIVMYEQKRGEDEECVFALDMEEGEMENFPCRKGGAAPSEYMADQAVRELAKWPREGEFKEHEESSTEFGQLRTGVHYGQNDYFAMSLNTTLGRFLVSSYVEFPYKKREELRSKNTLFLVVIAEIMWRLRPDDRALYYSVKEMLDFYWHTEECNEDFEGKMRIVRDLFSAARLPEFKAWERWKAEQGKVKVFFDHDRDEECEVFDDYDDDDFDDYGDDDDDDYGDDDDDDYGDDDDDY